MNIDNEPKPVDSAFSKLPREVVLLICDYACLNSTSPPALDRRTAVSLALVDRSFHSDFSAILYRQPDIQTPSQLGLSFRTIASNPGLGRLVTALFVGSKGAFVVARKERQPRTAFAILPVSGGLAERR